jgi:hypothetical protein
VRRFDVPTGDPQALALEGGSLTLNGPRQFYSPPPILLGAEPGEEGILGPIHIRVPIPDSRCRVKISVIFFPAQGTTIPDDLALEGTIWMAAYEEDQKGVSGSSGRTSPVTDLVGSKNAPVQFPASQGLAGYSREFVTAADWIEADITIGGVADASGHWVLQTRIQPDAVTLDWREWQQIRALFLPQRTT